MTDLKDCRVLVTPRSFGKDEPSLRAELEAQVGEVIYNTAGRSLTSDELAEMIPGIDGFIAGLDAIDRHVIEAADRLQVIARYGVGVDAVDLDAAHEKGIVVTNTPGANSNSVAELTIGLILALARQIPSAVRAAKSADFSRVRGMSLEGKVIGLLGFGAIGQRVARRLASFECPLLAYDPFANTSVAQQLGVQLVERDEVVRQADFLSLHLPVLPETRGMVDADFLAMMKPGSFLLNTSRGELVDEAALFEALQSDHLSGAALDALIDEPPASDHPLLSLEQVIITPHMGAHTDGATNAMGRFALQDCLAVLRGEEPVHRVV